MHLLTRHTFGVIGRQNGSSADIASLFTDRLRATVNYIIDQGRIQSIALCDGD
jgi:hypothetical protein